MDGPGATGGCLPVNHLLQANLGGKHELSNLDVLDLSYLKLVGPCLPSQVLRSHCLIGVF